MNNTLGNHIRTLRKQNKLTLKELSELSGISTPYLSELERDNVNPSIKVLESIAKSLDIILSELIDFNNEIESRFHGENKRLHKIIEKLFDEKEQLRSKNNELQISNSQLQFENNQSKQLIKSIRSMLE